jgi:hypothetical protein
MKTYAKMPDEATDRVAHLVKLFHPELKDAGVRIDLLSVSTDADGPALSHQGYPAMAVVRATNVKERTKGAGDVEIVVDEAAYLKLTDAEKDALLDHELEHATVVRDKKTLRFKLDCRGRPKIRMRKHDYQFGWFHSIAERHGAASLECKQAHSLVLRGAQTLFPFMKELPALTMSPADLKA